MKERSPRARVLLAAGLIAVVVVAAAVALPVAILRTDPDAEAASCPRPYADASPWNTPIPKGAASRQAGLSGTLTSDPAQYTYPVYVARRSTPAVRVRTTGWFSNVVAGGRRLVNVRRGVVRIPIPAGAAPAAGGDAQLIVVNPETGDEWGASNLEQRPGGGWIAWNAYHYNTRWSGVPPRDRHGDPFFLRGAGVPYLTGLVRPCEIAAGEIRHALAFAYESPSSEYVRPASKSDGVAAPGDGLPQGTRLQLDPSLTGSDLEERGCKGPCRTIARALQRYGMYVVDVSGRPKVMLEYERTARWKGIVGPATASPIPLAAFRVVPAGRPS
jgi:hypothetical protein